MATEPDSLPIQLAEGYRVARKNTSIFCALGLGWSAAQFDLKSISLGPAGNLDLSGASVAIILAGGIAYTMARCTIEFAMQTKEVRRWHLAQADFKLSVFVVRATVLILAASGLSRSVETVLYGGHSSARPVDRLRTTHRLRYCCFHAISYLHSKTANRRRANAN